MRTPRTSSASTRSSRRTTRTSSSARPASARRVIGVNARDLGTFRIDRAAQLDSWPSAPRDRVVVAESAVHTRAQAAAAELAGANAVLVGTSLMRAAEPGAKLRELLSRPLVKVCGLTRQEDVDAAVEAGADLSASSSRRARRAGRRPCSTVPDTVLTRRRLRRRARGARAPTSSSSTRDEEGTVRGRDAVLLRDGEPVARVADLPWEGEDPDHWQNARRRRRPPRARRAARPRQRARGDRAPCTRGRSTPRRRSSPRPASRTTRKVRAFVEEARA